MNKDSKLFLALISAVLITSGCVDGGGPDSDASPISINDFSITPNPAPGDQTVRVEMELQNNGDSDAKNVSARLFGASFPSNDPKTWRTTEGEGVSREYRTLGFNDLNAGTEASPARPQVGIESFISPNIDEGRITSDEFKAKIQYEYSTTASTEIQMMSDRRFQETGASRSPLTAENSKGPIQAEVQGSTPHVFYDDGTANEELCITLRNRGSGTPFLTTTENGIDHDEDAGFDFSALDDDDVDPRNKVEVRLEDVGNIQFDNEGSDESTVVNILDGQDGYQCYDMALTGLGTITDLEQTNEISIEVVYGYEEETSTSVTVEGRRSSSTSEEEDDDGGDDDELGDAPDIEIGPPVEVE